MQKKFVSYEYVSFIVDLLAQRVDMNCDQIIGIGRGGLIPATMLAYRLNKKVITYGISTFNGSVREDAHFTYQLPTLVPGNKYLVVDDICDSGNTFKIFKSKFKDSNCTFEYASLFVKDSTAKMVDHYGISVSDDIWVAFPWEVN
jgi:hypoxanthine phosphoribosyltransferase